MASRVSITTASVKRAMHTPGGVVYQWDKRVGREIKALATVKSPKNHRFNQLHREKWGSPHRPGDYKRSWDTHMTSGTNQHGSKVRVENTAPHAIYVEFGRRGSTEYQVFSWRKAPFIRGGRYAAAARAKPKPGKPKSWKLYLITAGGPNSYLNRTTARGGRYILTDATRTILLRYGIAWIAPSR